MKKLIASALLAFSAVTAPAYADGSTLLGAAIGGATGAIVGRQVAGRDGVILGAAIGGAAGAAIGHSAGERRRDRYVGREPVYFEQPAYAPPPQPAYYERRVVQHVYQPQPDRFSPRVYYPATYAHENDGWKHRKRHEHYYRHHRHWDHD